LKGDTKFGIGVGVSGDEGSVTLAYNRSHMKP